MSRKSIIIVSILSCALALVCIILCSQQVQLFYSIVCISALIISWGIVWKRNKTIGLVLPAISGLLITVAPNLTPNNIESDNILLLISIVVASMISWLAVKTILPQNYSKLLVVLIFVISLSAAKAEIQLINTALDPSEGTTISAIVTHKSAYGLFDSKEVTSNFEYNGIKYENVSFALNSDEYKTLKIGEEMKVTVHDGFLQIPYAQPQQ